ncbi:unnamed protein product [Calicophoron daubneyi]|uniref:Uncharacterized protein n=1 Tax=Calicophoron daubneyi TaxID=300641 RepID=A0AAV2TXC1_CALDB
MSDVFPKALSSDDDVNGDVISQSVEQHVLLHPTPSLKPGVVYRLTAQMYGRHIAIKGPLALQQFNVSFELHTGKFNVEKMNRETKTIRLKSCVTFTASKQILPRTTLRGACHNLPLFQWSRSPTEVGHLEWAKRSTVFTMNRCAGRVRLHTDFHISSDLLPRLHEHDISVISFRLRVITAILIGLLLLLLGFGIRQTNSSLNVQGSQITNFQPTEPLINQVK